MAKDCVAMTRTVSIGVGWHAGQWRQPWRYDDTGRALCGVQSRGEQPGGECACGAADLFARYLQRSGGLVQAEHASDFDHQTDMLSGKYAELPSISASGRYVAFLRPMRASPRRRVTRRGKCLCATRAWARPIARPRRRAISGASAPVPVAEDAPAISRDGQVRRVHVFARAAVGKSC